MDENDQLDQLYEDAFYWHLISKGYSQERARWLANNRMKKLREAYHEE